MNQNMELINNDEQKNTNNNYDNKIIYNNKESDNSQKNIKKSSSGRKIIIYSVIGFASCLIIFGIILNLKEKNDRKVSSSTIESVTETNAFFLQKKESSKYGLFNTDGTNLSGYIYDNVDDFFNGVAVVEKDDKYALINTKGKEIIKYGEYDFISNNRGGLYEVRDKKGNYHIVNSKGKKVYSYKAEENTKFEGFIVSDLYSYVVDGDKIILFNVYGKKMKEYRQNEDANSKGLGSEPLDDYIGDYDDLFTSMYYDGNLTIFDNSDFHVVYDGKIDYPYRLSMVAYNNQSFFLEPITYMDLDDGKDRKTAIIYKKQFKEIDFTLIRMEGDCYTEYVTGQYKDGDTSIINPDGSKGLHRKGDFNPYIMSLSNYVSSDYGDRIDFYVDNKKVSSLENAYINDDGINNVYLVHLQEDDYKETWYDIQGNRILKEAYYNLGFPDHNDRAIATKEKKGATVLIDRSGKEVSSEYDRIMLLDEGMNNKKTKYYSVEKDGKVIIEPKYNENFDVWSDFATTKDGGVIVVGRYKDGNEELYSSKKGVLFSNEGRDNISIEKSYITNSIYKKGNNNIEYYTYDGKKFHTLK